MRTDGRKSAALDGTDFDDRGRDDADDDTVTSASACRERSSRPVTDIGSRPPRSSGRHPAAAGAASWHRGRAPTTTAFGLPLLAIVDWMSAAMRALVPGTTRELAMQSAQAIEDFAARGPPRCCPRVRRLTVRRRSARSSAVPRARRRPHREGRAGPVDVRTLVLDEADEVLRMGFAEDVETIASVPPMIA